MHHRPPLQRWLARLSFSFLILAFVLAYEANRAGGTSRGSLLGAGAVVAFGVGLAGVRERHRSR